MFKFFNLLITFVSLGIKTIKTLLLLLAHKRKVPSAAMADLDNWVKTAERGF